MQLSFLTLIFLAILCSCNSSQFQSVDAEKLYLSSLASLEQMETEEFVLGEKKSLVDILVVADTSESMYHHLDNLGQSLSNLLSVISYYDWQIGITSSDHGDHTNPLGLQQSWRDHVLEPHGKFGGLMNLESGGRLLHAKILTPKFPNYEDIFFHTLSHDSSRNCNFPPYCHPSLEQPLRSLKATMHRAQLDNSSFFRPEADLISLIITNEEERAEDRRRATQAEQVVQTFNQVFGHLSKKFIAYNILVIDRNCQATEREKTEVARIGQSIAKLADLTGGENISICNRNYGQALKSISRHIKNSLEKSIVLKKEPIPETLQLEFKDSELAWELQGRKIKFKKLPSRPVYVSISYQSRD